jgi:hypothetical protein
MEMLVTKYDRVILVMNNDTPEPLSEQLNQNDESLSTDSAARRRAFKLRRLSHEPLRVPSTHGIVDIHGSQQATVPSDMNPGQHETPPTNGHEAMAARNGKGVQGYPLAYFPLSNEAQEIPLSGGASAPIEVPINKDVPKTEAAIAALPLAGTHKQIAQAPPTITDSANTIVAAEEPYESADDLRRIKRRKRTKRLIYTGVILLLLVAAFGALVITNPRFTNVAIKMYVKPQLENWVHEKFGDGYTFQMRDITLSPNHDSLIITGVRLAENGNVAANTGLKPGEMNAIEQFTVDTIKIGAFDYYKLLSQDGLFAGSITMHSPKIYLRPGILPNFATNNKLFPSFLPILSTKTISIDNAEIFYADEAPAGTSGSSTMQAEHHSSTPTENGVVIKHASLELRDFFIDESSFQKGTRTFFSKSAAFTASDISHLNAKGTADAQVVAVNGNLIDSSLHVTSIQLNDPVREVRRVVLDNIEMSGVNWNGLLTKGGLQATRMTLASPKIFLQPNLKYPTIKMTDKLPLPSLLPSISVKTIAVTNGEIYDLLPQSRTISTLKRISIVLHDFAIDASTPVSNIGSFFSHNVNFAIKGVTTLSTRAGSVRFADVKGTEKSLMVSNIRVQPAQKGVHLLALRSASINGLNWTKLLMHKGFFSGSIVLKQPDVYLDPPSKNAANEITKTAPNADPLAVLKGFTKFPLSDEVPIIAAGTISVTDAKLHGLQFFDGPADAPGAIDSVAGLQLSLKNFKLDRASYLAKRGMLFSTAGTFKIGPIVHYAPGDIYRYTEGGISGNFAAHTLTIDSLVYQPVISEDSFGTLYKYRTNRYEAFAPRVILNGFDYQRFVTGQGLFADSVFVQSFKVALFADKRLESPPRTEKEIFPQEAFQHITTLFGFKSVVVNDGDVSFSERWPSGSESGKISMDSIHATMGPISNDPSIVTPTTPTEINGDMRIMGAGFFSYKIDYQLLNPQLAIQARGRVDSMNASVFNDYLIHAEPFKLTGGLIQSAEFQIAINDSTMSGMLLPLYDNLRVEFFRYDGFPPGLFSLLANYIYMRSHNSVEKDHPPMTAKIDGVISRDDNFFWSLWLPVRTAVSSVVGIPHWVW